MIKRAPIFKLLGSVLGLLFTSVAVAQDTSKTLDPVPVFALKDLDVRLAVMTSTVPHFRLNPGKLDELGVVDVGEALKYVPGAQIRDYGGIGGIKTISYRSLGAGHTSVHLDGNQLNNVQNGSINLSSFELFGLSRVSFASGTVADMPGSASAYIGANTIALKSVLATMPYKLRIGAYSNTTTINAFEKGLYVQKGLGNQFFIGGQGMVKFGSGQYEFIHPETPQMPPVTRENSGLFGYRGRLVIGRYGLSSKLLFSVYHLNNEQELPGAAVLFNPSNDQKLWRKNTRFNLNYDYSIRKWRLITHANHQMSYTRYNDPYFLNLDGFIDSRFRQHNTDGGFLLSRRFRFPIERVFAGADVIYSQLEGDQFSNLPARLQLNSVLGGSTAFGKFKVSGHVATQYILDETDSDLTERNTFFKLSPFLSVGYLPFKKAKLRLRTFYKNTFRMPSFNDLYYNFIGNNNLKPEDANLFNLGVTYRKIKKSWTVEFTADTYYNTVKNKIIAIPTKDLFNWSMQNIGETEIRGFDVGAIIIYDLKKWQFVLNGNYAFNASLDVTDPLSTTYKKQIPYTPFETFTGSFSVGWNGFKFSSNILISGFRYSLNENIYANLLPGFTDINFGLSKRITFRKNVVLADVKLMNALNKNYQVIRSFPMPGRYVQLRLKYTLNK